VQFLNPLGKNASVSIIGANGAELEKISGPVKRINVSLLSPGVYMVKVVDQSVVKSYKFIKK
jgi:hypothetical protein